MPEKEMTLNQVASMIEESGKNVVSQMAVLIEDSRKSIMSQTKTLIEDTRKEIKLVAEGHLVIRSEMKQMEEKLRGTSKKSSICLRNT